MGKYPTDIKELFSGLPQRFRSGKTDRPLIYYFSIDEEKWSVSVGPESCQVIEGKTTDEADCFLKTSREMFDKTVRGDYTPTIMDFMTGKIKTNRPELLLTFRDIFGD